MPHRTQNIIFRVESSSSEETPKTPLTSLGQVKLKMSVFSATIGAHYGASTVRPFCGCNSTVRVCGGGGVGGIGRSGSMEWDLGEGLGGYSNDVNRLKTV